MADYRTIPEAYDGPARIYLQWCDTGSSEGVTWCADQINDDDVEYVTAAQLESAERQIADLQRHNELLRAVAEDDDAIAAAMDAYAKHRHPARWDGEPWGQAGRQNHENAIRAAVQAAVQAAIDGGAMGEG